MFMSTRTRLRALHPPSRVGLPDQHAILGLSEREKKIEVGLIRSLLWALKPPKGPYEGRKEEREREREKEAGTRIQAWIQHGFEREREREPDGRTDGQADRGRDRDRDRRREGRARKAVRERERERETTRKGRRERDRETGRDCRCLLRSKFKAKPNAPNLQPELCSAGPLKFKADENITNTTVLIPASSRSSQPEFCRSPKGENTNTGISSHKTKQEHHRIRA